MYWASDRCDTVPTQNPETCRNYEHHVLRPVGEAQLRQRSAGAETPEAVDLEENQTVGPTPDPDSASSPDMPVDGSVDGRTATRSSADESPGLIARLRAWLPL